MNNGSANTNAPTLAVRFMTPPPGQIRPQGLESASADPTAENISFWGNWHTAKGTYRGGKKVAKMRYMLEVIPPGALSCDYAFEVDWLGALVCTSAPGHPMGSRSVPPMDFAGSAAAVEAGKRWMV